MFQTKLEKQIDKAIEHGDFSTAEELSDHLAVREVCLTCVYYCYMFLLDDL